MIKKEQVWVWSEFWQKGKKEADRHIQEGRTSAPMTSKEASTWLDEELC